MTNMQQNIELNLEETKKALVDLKKLVDVSAKTKTTSKEGNISAYAKVKNILANNLKRAKSTGSSVSFKLNYSDIRKAYKAMDITAATALVSGVPAGENFMKVPRKVPVLIQDEVEVRSIPRNARQYFINTLSDMSTIANYTPVAEGIVKPQNTSNFTQTAMNVVKVAWHEVNTLEADRFHDANALIEDLFLVKLEESIHYYILQTLATVAGALPAGALPGAGTVANPTILDAFTILSEALHNFADAGPGTELHIWIPRNTYFAYTHVKDLYGRYFFNPYEDVNASGFVSKIDGAVVAPHGVDSLVTGHALNGANNILVYDTNSVFVYVDSEVEVIVWPIPESNQFRIIVETFVAAAALPQLNRRYFALSGAPGPLVYVTNQAFLTSNI